MVAQVPGAPRGAPDQESAAGLFGRLFSDASALLRNELALARAEFRETTSTLKAGLGAMAIGAAFLLAGVLAVIAAIILALAQAVAPWLAALIVGVVLAVVGLIMLQAARRKLEPRHLALERTQSSLKRDAEVVAHMRRNLQ